MIDLEKIITFRDGIGLTNGVYDIDHGLLSTVGKMVNYGRDWGLHLDRFEINDEEIYFEWTGTKRNVLNYYTYYSKNVTHESPESINDTIWVILKK